MVIVASASKGQVLLDVRKLRRLKMFRRVTLFSVRSPCQFNLHDINDLSCISKIFFKFSDPCDRVLQLHCDRSLRILTRLIRLEAGLAAWLFAVAPNLLAFTADAGEGVASRNFDVGVLIDVDRR